MEKEYDYSHFIEILNGIYNQKKISEQSSIEWNKLARGATDSIIDKLYQFETDNQRIGFLNAIFKRLFSDGKNYNLSLVESQGVKGFENESEFQYIQNCKLILNELITDVSETCIQYEGIDFNKIMKGLNIDPSDYVWYCRKGVEKLPPKEYISRTRARAFCIIEILKQPEHTETKFSKKGIIELVKKEFPEQSGKTVYEERGKITDDIEKAKNKHKLDYEYGLKLYKEKYPD